MSSGFYAQHPTERSNEGDAAPVDVRGPETLAGTRLVSGTFFYALQNGGGVNCGSYQNCGGKGENCRKQLQVSSVFNSLIRMAKERHFGQFSFAAFDAPKPSVAFSALAGFLLPGGLSLFLGTLLYSCPPQNCSNIICCRISPLIDCIDRLCRLSFSSLQSQYRKYHRQSGCYSGIETPQRKVAGTRRRPCGKSRRCRA